MLWATRRFIERVVNEESKIVLVTMEKLEKKLESLRENNTIEAIEEIPVFVQRKINENIIIIYI